MSLSQNILDAVEILANSSISKAGYDRTIQAQVLSCEDASIGRYRCRYQDSTIYAYSNNLDTSYNKGDYVYILVPSNDMKKEKTILCTSSRRGNNFVSETKEEDEYNVIGSNCILSTRKYYLNTDNLNYSYNIYSQENVENALRIDAEAVERYIKNADAFKISLMIKTLIPINRQSRGSYGLIFTLVFKDNTLEKEVERVYIINEDNMSGNPYKYKNNTKQTAIFKIDGKNFVKIKQIKLFNKDFPNTAAAVTSGDLSSGDVAISALTLYGLEAIDIESNENVAVSFSTPEGIILTESIDTIPITAQVRVNNKLVSSDQKLKFYWGIEDAGITPSSVYYNKYLGSGWRCLNEYNTISSVAVDWVPNSETFNYTKDYDDTLLTIDNNIRVAVLFNDNTYTNELVIHNSKNTNINLISDAGTVFYYDKGTPKITCSITGRVGEYTYKWGQETNTGLFRALEETSNNITVAVKKITDFTKIKCSIYEGTTYRGTAAIILINSIKQDELSLIEGWDGKTVQINEDSILSPRVGAGKKDNNGFTGVVMGVLKQYSENSDVKEKIGLLGYANSERSFFLNSENGSAIFGLDEGSIIVDPASKQALLYSKSFWRNYNENGLPNNYADDNESGSGMLIDLSTPAIRFGSGNFSVDSNGNLKANNADLTGTMKTTSNQNGYQRTQLSGGTIKVFYGKSQDTLSEIMTGGIWGSSYATQYCFLGNSAIYDGIAIGEKTPLNTIYTYYRCNIKNAEIAEDCRHYFGGGKVKIVNQLEVNGQTFFKSAIDCSDGGYLKFNKAIALRYWENNGNNTGLHLGIDGDSLILHGKLKNISFENNYGIVCNNRIALRYRDVKDTEDNTIVGLYIGQDNENLSLVGTNIYANGSPVSVSSDARKKQEIKNLDSKYLQLMKEINSVSFKYNTGTSTSGRVHTGFIAQDVQAAMQKCGISSNQFAAFVDLNKDGSEYALRYEEFISPMLLYIKSLEKQIELLKQKVGI